MALTERFPLLGRPASLLRRLRRPLEPCVLTLPLCPAVIAPLCIFSRSICDGKVGLPTLLSRAAVRSPRSRSLGRHRRGVAGADALGAVRTCATRPVLGFHVFALATVELAVANLVHLFDWELPDRTARRRGSSTCRARRG
ncbi:hypothetical protein EJB05_35612, partial [Eragrostis curvula]